MRLDPSPDQQAWAAESWQCVIGKYGLWSDEGVVDYAPMLTLLEAIRSPEAERDLSLGTSLTHLVIALSSGLEAPNRLSKDCPGIGITQTEHGFRFVYSPNGRTGHTHAQESSFQDGSRVLESFLLRLQFAPKR